MDNSNHNNANQLISDTVNSATNIYTYDGNGNLTTKTQSSQSWDWEYDYDNRLISYTDSARATSYYTYDAMSRRISKTINSVTKKYFYDGQNIIYDYELQSGIWNLKSAYLTPLTDQNVLMVNNSNTYYFMQDGLGSVRNLVSSVESVVNTYDYTAFGESLNWAETVTNRYTYTSREWDGESQTYHYRARQYNPATGRFLRRDPAEDIANLNLYTYVSNNPINLTDPTGLEETYAQQLIKKYGNSAEVTRRIAQTSKEITILESKVQAKVITEKWKKELEEQIKAKEEELQELTDAQLNILAAEAARSAQSRAQERQSNYEAQRTATYIAIGATAAAATMMIIEAAPVIGEVIGDILGGITGEETTLDKPIIPDLHEPPGVSEPAPSPL